MLSNDNGKPVLRGEVGQAVRKQIQEICRGHDLEILQGHVRPDMSICCSASRRTCLRVA